MNRLHTHLPRPGGWLTIALAIALGGCSQVPGEPQAADAVQAQTEQRAERDLSTLSALGVEELRRRSAAALQAQRLHSPAGDNAFEYYLALRNAHPSPDAATESALIDLMPYAVIGAEDALARRDYIEAERLRVLIAAADPVAPALPRIARMIAEGRATTVLPEPQTGESASIDSPKPAATAVPSSPAPRPLTAQTMPLSLGSSPVMSRSTAAVDAPSSQDAAPVVATAKPPAPAPMDTPPQPRPSAVGTALIPIRAPQPGRPTARTNEGAQIVASYTVNPDGSVSDIAVSSVGKRQLAFERNVEMTLRRWRYQPIANARTVTQRFEFAAMQ